MYPIKYFMDFVQILYVGFSNFDDTNMPAKGMEPSLVQHLYWAFAVI